MNLRAIRAALTPHLGAEWYEAIFDSPAEAKARMVMDKAAATGSESAPFSDGASFDPRMNGRHN